MHLDNLIHQEADHKIKIRRIGTMAENTSHEDLFALFLLQDCSEEVLEAKKAKVIFWTKRDLAAAGFRNKIKNSGFITVNVFSKSSLAEILKFLRKESDPVIKVLSFDLQNYNRSDSEEILFGRTIREEMTKLSKKYQNPVALYEAVRKALQERKKLIAELIKEFKENYSESGILAEKDALSFGSIKSEADNNLIRPIAHLAFGIDILFHRRDEKSSNFISAGERGKKYLPAIHQALLAEEYKQNPIASEFWHFTDKIYSDLGKISSIKFAGIKKIIEKAAQGKNQPVLI